MTVLSSAMLLVCLIMVACTNEYVQYYYGIPYIE